MTDYYNEIELKNRFEDVTNLLCEFLAKIVRKKYGKDLGVEKRVKMSLTKDTSIMINAKSIIIDNKTEYICIDVSRDSFDISHQEMDLRKEAEVANVLDLAVLTTTKFANKYTIFLDNDFSDHGDVQLLTEVAFDTINAEPEFINFRFGEYEAYIDLARLEIFKNSERVMLLDRGVCFIDKKANANLLTNIILLSSQKLANNDK